MEVQTRTYTPWQLWSFLATAPRLEILYHSIHYLDLVRSWFGNPEGVYCKTVRNPQTPQLAPTKSTIILDYGTSKRVLIATNHGHSFGDRYQRSFAQWEGTAGAARITLGLNLDYPTASPTPSSTPSATHPKRPGTHSLSQARTSPTPSLAPWAPCRPSPKAPPPPSPPTSKTPSAPWPSSKLVTAPASTPPNQSPPNEWPSEPALRQTIPLYLGFAATGVGVALPGAILPTLLLRWHLGDEGAGRLFFLAFLGSSLGALLTRSLRLTLAAGSFITALAAAALVVAQPPAVHLFIFSSASVSAWS